MPQLKFMLPLLVPEHQLVHSFPKAYNEWATPFGQSKDFTKATRIELQASQHRWKMRPCKVIFIGDVSVGKTAIVNRFCYNIFQMNYKATIGVDFEIENMNVLGQNFCLEMWDTAGQERFKCIAQAYYRNANAIVMVYDMTKPETLAAVQGWLKSALAVNSMHQPLIFLVGTKSDLLSREAFVLAEKSATEMAKSLEAEYWSISSRTGFNVVRFFHRMTALAFEIAFKETLLDRERETSISAQMRKKSTFSDFRTYFGCNSTGSRSRSFCLC